MPVAACRRSRRAPTCRRCGRGVGPRREAGGLEGGDQYFILGAIVSLDDRAVDLNSLNSVLIAIFGHLLEVVVTLSFGDENRGGDRGPSLPHRADADELDRKLALTVLKFVDDAALG